MVEICHDCGLQKKEVEFVDGNPYCRSCYEDNRKLWNRPSWEDIHSKDGRHIHGCGHPAKPLFFCKTTEAAIMIAVDYPMWRDYHDEAPEGKCLCFKCWMDRQKKKEADDNGQTKE